MNAEVLPANGDALQGARRATEDASPIAPPNPEVAATARRRQFSAAEPECVNDFATPCVINLMCMVVLFQSVSFARAVG